MLGGGVALLWFPRGGVWCGPPQGRARDVAGISHSPLAWEQEDLGYVPVLWETGTPPQFGPAAVQVRGYKWQEDK
ncbi:hypothetical protein Y1Q_0015816 [Alligator mississippiensis]|uniref:Uncharacterized protein n=1 Tax=Alligator mississippiensis TaxID=8496 RepID=A0A151MH29_ALLMI|nr:hypothetical protein Y1Q_0015816 [Alligator mississippiensis]